MSQYYNPQRSRNLYKSGGEQPFRISRSKIDLFKNCPRCFYIDRRLGTGQPPGYPFAINSAVDNLLKKEFDRHRQAGTPHPLQAEHGLDQVPAAHPQIDEWRENFKGVQYHHEPTNLIVTGAIDDLWVDADGTHYVVDYKATAKTEPVKTLDKAMAGRLQAPEMEVYQWLLRRNSLAVSDTSYFVYCTGRSDAETFDGKVVFDVNLNPLRGQRRLGRTRYPVDSRMPECAGKSLYLVMNAITARMSLRSANT